MNGSVSNRKDVVTSIGTRFCPALVLLFHFPSAICRGIYFAFLLFVLHDLGSFDKHFFDIAPKNEREDRGSLFLSFLLFLFLFLRDLGSFGEYVLDFVQWLALDKRSNFRATKV